MAHRDIVKETRATRKSSVMEPACRLFGLVAREARKVVVFRRGPSQQTCLVLWDLATDQFEIGQWVKTRVREQWSDVSPDASYLVYLADDYWNQGKKSFAAYTAISRPPHFAAFTLWRDVLIGKWLTNRTLVFGSIVPVSEFNWLPSRIVVRGTSEREAHLIRRPPRRYRLLRDGWTYSGPAIPPAQFDLKRKAKYGVEFNPPITIAKRSLGGFTLEDRLLARNPRHSGGPNEKIELAMLKPDGSQLFAFHDADWADFDNNGDLLFAWRGCLYRLEAERIAVQPDAAAAIAAAQRLIDLSPLRFEAKRAPYADSLAAR